MVKALADFPNVIYLLSFDKLVVAEALAKSLGVNGSAYLRRSSRPRSLFLLWIVLACKRKLFAELDVLINSLPDPRRLIPPTGAMSILMDSSTSSGSLGTLFD